MTIAAIILILTGIVLLWVGSRTRASTGLPNGHVVSRDTAGLRKQKPPEALVSHRYRLAGRPDYLIRENDALIPVEVKPARRADEPYESDIVQLFTYCLLVEETESRPPPYGLLIYVEQQWRFDYTADARQTVLDLLADLQADRSAHDVARSHDHAGRCRACGQRANCSEALV